MRWLFSLLAVTALIVLLAGLNSKPSGIAPTLPIKNEGAVTQLTTNNHDLLADSYVDIDGSQLTRTSGEDWLNTEVRQLFDFFIALYEEGEQQMWLAFNRYCEPLEHCPELSFLFQRYVQYKQRIAALDQQQLRLAQEFEERLYQLAELQRDLFSEAEVEVLFAHQQSWDDQAIARLKIRQDETLDAQQKALLLEEHFAQLPEQMKPAVEPTMQLRQVSQLMDTGIDQGDYNLLSATYGDDSANRLLELQRSKDNWRERVEVYSLEKERLAQRHSNNTVTLNRELDLLKQTMFDANESKRLAVYLTNPSLLNSASKNYQ